MPTPRKEEQIRAAVRELRTRADALDTAISALEHLASLPSQPPAIALLPGRGGRGDAA